MVLFIKKYPDFHIFHLEYLFLYYFKPCLVNCQQIWARDGHSPHSKLAMTSKNCEKEKESLPTLCGLSWLYWKAWVWSRWRRWERRGQAQGQPYHCQLVRYIYMIYIMIRDEKDNRAHRCGKLVFRGVSSCLIQIIINHHYHYSNHQFQTTWQGTERVFTHWQHGQWSSQHNFLRILSWS